MQFKQPNENSKNFLKLKDKESIVGIFRGDLYDFRQHWINSRSQPCKGNKTECELCQSGNKSTFRFRVNFITKENPQSTTYIPKIFEQAWGVYEQLRALHEGDYQLPQTIVRITRSGVDKNTSYTVIPIPNYQVTPQLESLISQVKLHDLVNPEGQQQGAQLGDNPPPLGDEDIPF